jgi:hypothetical protein
MFYIYLYIKKIIYFKKLLITNTKMKYIHKDPIFLETKTFTKHMESLQISILPFTYTMRDCENSFPGVESEKIPLKNHFLESDTRGTPRARALF